MKNIITALATTLVFTQAMACIGNNLLSISDSNGVAMVVYDRYTGEMLSKSKSHAIVSIKTEDGTNICVDSQCSVLIDVEVSQKLLVTYKVFPANEQFSKIINDVQIGNSGPRARGMAKGMVQEKQGLTAEQIENLSTDTNIIGCGQRL